VEQEDKKGVAFGWSLGVCFLGIVSYFLYWDWFGIFDSPLKGFLGCVILIGLAWGWALYGGNKQVSIA
jgi:hypothetical protein